MSYGTDTSDLTYRWSQVCGVFFHRYPNPWSKHVLSDDVISREVCGDVMKTVRVVVKKNKIPRMFTSLFRGRANDGLYIEESYINRASCTIISYTRTVSFRSLGLFDERCSYTPSTNNSLWTCLKREAWATGNGRSFITRPLEKFVVSKYRGEAKKSSKGLHYVLQQFYGTGENKQPRTPLLRMPTLPKIACEKKQCTNE